MILRYFLVGAASVGASAISALCFMFNPITILLMSLTGWAVSLLGRQPPGGFSAMGPAFTISIIWPLLVAPAYWLAFRALRWRARGFLGLFLVANLAVAFVVMLVNSVPLG